MGDLAYPNGDPRVGEELAKVQDTIPICPTQISQEVALGALEAGRGWAEERVAGLSANRAAVAAAFSRLGAESVWGDSAIYLFGECGRSSAGRARGLTPTDTALPSKANSRSTVSTTRRRWNGSSGGTASP